MNNINDLITSFIIRAQLSSNAIEALQYTQAAVNAANALKALQDIKETNHN